MQYAPAAPTLQPPEQFYRRARLKSGGCRGPDQKFTKFFPYNFTKNLFTCSLTTQLPNPVTLDCI